MPSPAMRYAAVHKAAKKIFPTAAEASKYIGGLSNPSKMPCKGWSIPAQACKIGSVLQSVEGSTCSGCYALKGMYYFPNVKRALARRISILLRALNGGVSERLKFILAFVRLLGSGKTKYFRWHDSGDVQSLAHLRLIVSIAKVLPDVYFWLPTREYRIVQQYLRESEEGKFPDNLTVRLSAHMVDGKPPSISNLPTSTVHSKGSEPIGRECPAPTQDGECKDCRLCWHSYSNISYKQH